MSLESVVVVLVLVLLDDPPIVEPTLSTLAVTTAVAP
jgi:hypothetical protein